MTDTPNSAEKRLPESDPIPVETLAADEGQIVAGEAPAQDGSSLRHESLEEPLAKAAEAPPTRSPEEAPHSMPTAAMSRPAGSGFLPMLLGGALAAAIGAGATWYLLPRLTPPAPVQDISALTGRINQQANDISQLRTRLDDLPPPPAPVSLEPLESGIAEVRNNLIGTQSTVSALAERLGTLETRAAEAPAGTGTAGPEVSGLISDLQNQIAEQTRRAEALSASLTELSGTMESRIAGEAQSASRAAADAIGARIALAVEAGLPFQIMLDQARESGIAVPEALTSHAGGVPSLAALRDDFPPAARAALEQSNLALAGSGMGDRMTAFVLNQLGIRSLNPQEGAGPDAVLSRMEAAVSAGRIQEALSEAGQLPPEGQQAMSAWLAGAKARVEALSAAQALAPASGN